MAKIEEGPDQARSWAIAMAGFVICGLLSGVTRTSGLFYVALIETYGVSRMKANMPFTLRNVVRDLAGPIVGIIGQRYGVRVITFVGGIFASLGMALCCFAPNVTWISVLWGGVHGIGVALANTLFPVVINQYFLKYRATASGLSISGSCIGSFIFPAALEYMLRHIGLAGSFLITGGFLLHVLPASILMTEPTWMKKIPVAKPTVGKKNNSTRSVSQTIQKLGEIREDAEGVTGIYMKKIPSSEVICEEVKNTEDSSFQPTTRSARVFSRNGIDNPAFNGLQTELNEKNAEPIKEGLYEEIRLRTISIGEVSITVPEPFNREVQETSLRKGIVKVISSPMFHVISLSFAGLAMLYDSAITFIVDYIQDKGLHEDDAKYFISMMSLGDLLGRLCFGWVTDRNYITMPKFMLLLQVVQGLCFLLLPLFYGFGTLMTIITIYGLAAGACLVMYPILIAKYLVSVQSLAMGFITIFAGLLTLAVPPLIGYFRDNAGSYNGMFIIAGSLSIAVGCFWIFEPLFVRLQKAPQ